ncbi:MAG: ATP-binding cassette domain-containing protein [Crocinitomicaceae bacterium]|nr:ATP-binding cassette domain-containing protein [Crocinitomicaceae bacterium]
MIEVENISKTFKLSKKQKKELNTKDEFSHAVKNVSFTCQPGRVFSLLGPNGAGKTTTLRMISTIFKPTDGSIKVCGLDTQKDELAIRKKIGFLTGSTGLYQRLTPNEILNYFGKLYKLSDTEINQRKSELYSLLDMESFQNKRLGKLSTGMKQKVSIARTMIHDPEVVIFDEPTSGLDVITSENIIQLIKSCKDQGKTVIFSSHIMSEVDLLCDDMAIIDQGEILFSGTMDQFRSEMKEKTLTGEFIRIVNEKRAQ